MMTMVAAPATARHVRMIRGRIDALGAFRSVAVDCDLPCRQRGSIQYGGKRPTGWFSSLFGMGSPTILLDRDW